MKNKKIFFIIAGFDDYFLDNWSLDGCALRWLLNLSKPKLVTILLALKKPRLMATYFLYNQDIII